ncbi:MAG TPA: LytS/YhcK type 5TM receptor domain-containing protein [Spirochaetota bacterium]|nr:LytS/YhcK type 5TM receptor domain-containing protein [Spirochaetota bacterium]
MHSSTIIGLINNTALLLALGVLYDTLIRTPQKQKTFRELITGFLVGIAGIAIMMNPVGFMPGIVFDTRSILLGISGLFFGPLVTLVAIIMTGTLRLYQGGAGAITGTAVIIMSGSAGLLWSYFRRQKIYDKSFWELLLFGAFVHAGMLLLMLTLTREAAVQVITKLGIPILVIYPPGTALLGLLMVRRYNRSRTEEQLRESEYHLRNLIDNTSAGYFHINNEGLFSDVNQAWLEMHGFSSRNEVIGKHFNLTQVDTDLPMADDTVKHLMKGKTIASAEFSRKRKDGTTGYHTFSAHTVMRNGKPEGIEGFLIDRTENARLQEEVEAANIKLQSTIADMERTNNALNIVNSKLFEANKDLADSEERYRLLFKEMMSGFALHEIIQDDHGVPVDYRFLVVNSAFEKITGLKSADITGKTVREVLPDIESYWIERYGHVAATGAPVQFEDYSSSLDKYYEVRAYSPERGKFAVIIQDITARKHSEKRIENALREKEILLRELYHRTKNNMQVIQSMLLLQSIGTESDEVKTLVSETDMKIQAMSLVHQMLYQSQNLSSINLKKYISDLSKLVTESTNFPAGRVSFELTLIDTEVTVDIAIPCGLVLNELMTNTIKYAFPEDMKGTITISLDRVGEKLHILYSDNGVGVPENFDFHAQKSYGMRSIFSIIERQLQGEINVTTGNGIAFSIFFNDSHYTPRV